MLPRIAAAFSAFAFLACALDAQFVGPGLSWSGSSGNGVRSFVPNCTNLPVTAVPGETVTLTVWGDMMAPFALFAAYSGTQCTPIPGLGNALILDPPLVTVTFGALTLVTPCLSCPPGLQNLTFTVPLTVPAGASVAFQAASLGSGMPVFTAAITGTV
jgi:hypothetical protein